MSTSLETELAQALERSLRSTEGARETPSNLAESMRYSLLAPGKRIRPRLALACARLIGLAPQAALPAALSIEMVHCFTLIHDDLPCMDDDDFRRGRPSNHKVHGEAVALLAGDALIAVAVEALAESASHVAAPAFARAVRRLCRAIGPRGVIGGQALEMQLTPASPIADLRRTHALKTGALFEASLLIPHDLAGVEGERSRAIESFARELGSAFQVADDLDDAGESATPEPSSILAHLTPTEAARQSVAGLESALAALQAAWGGEPARELAAIAGEVVAALRKWAAIS